VSLNLLRTSLAFPERVAKKILDQTGLLAKAKKLWRNRLRKKESASPSVSEAS